MNKSRRHKAAYFSPAQYDGIQLAETIKGEGHPDDCKGHVIQQEDAVILKGEDEGSFQTVNCDNL